MWTLECWCELSRQNKKDEDDEIILAIKMTSSSTQTTDSKPRKSKTKNWIWRSDIISIQVINTIAPHLISDFFKWAFTSNYPVITPKHAIGHIVPGDGGKRVSFVASVNKTCNNNCQRKWQILIVCFVNSDALKLVWKYFMFCCLVEIHVLSLLYHRQASMCYILAFLRHDEVNLRHFECNE